MEVKHFRLLFALELLFILLISISTTANAQKGEPSGAMRQELKAYNEQQIMPVLRELRLNFEAELTAADKQQLESLRAEKRNLQQTAKELHQKYKTQETKAMPTEEQKAAFKALREQKKQLSQNVAALAEKYKPQLAQAQQRIATERARWEQDLKAIAVKHKPELADKIASENRKGHRFGRRAPYHKLARPANFLLWKAGQANADNKPATTVFPNPAQNSNTIAYTVAKPGNVKITLLDANGNALRTLLNENKNKGVYTLEVDLNKLPSATYFYKIESAAGIETKRVIKN